MMLKKTMLAAAGAALALASIGGAHASAAQVPMRVSSDAGDSNSLFGSTYAIGLALLVVLAATVIVVEKSDDPDSN